MEDALSPGTTTVQPDEETPSARVEHIRRRMAVLSDPFRASYLEWFGRARGQAVDDSQVPPILEAAVQEMDALESRYQAGEIVEAGLAYGREQIRGLLDRLTTQPSVSAPMRDRVRHLIIDSFQPRLLSSDGRYTQDWFTYHEEQWLRHFGYLAGRPGLLALEVGSFEGRSASWTVQHLLTGEGSRLICVEPFGQYDDQERNFDHNIGLTGCVDKVVKLRGLSHQALPLLPEQSFDFIYVDGSHLVLDVIQDAAMCWRLVKPGGVVVFDDYEHTLFPDSSGMSAGPAVRAFLTLVDGEYELLFRDWQVALRKDGGD